MQPIHYTVTFATSACGIDDLVETDKFAGVGTTDASGVQFGGGTFEFTITNPATGKAVRYEQNGMGTADSAPVPNGDGTFTVHFTLSGMFKYSSLPGGPLESGEGHVAVVAVLDSSFNVISFQAHSGGSTPLNNNDPCPLIVSALT
jgi:hypothetical protein